MRILFVDDGSRSLSHLEQILHGHETKTIRFEEFDFGDPTRKKDVDLIILSGGGQYSVVGNEARFTKEIEFIRASPLPILGICFGSELIAYTFGATLTPLSKKVVGPYALTLLMPGDPLFANHPPLQVFESHRWAITSLSSDLVGLARSENGYEIIRHKTLPRLGFQFHPESPYHTTGGTPLLENALADLTQK